MAALVAATPAIADSASAEASFERGRSLLEAGNPRAACAAFQESLDDEFQYGTLYNLAGCHAKLGHLAQAWRLYTRLGEEDTNPGRRARSRELAKQLWQRVPKLIVDVKQPPAELAVRLDGDDIATKLKQPIPVDAGEHVVLATAPGHREWRTTAHVEAASAEVRVAIELERTDAPAHAPAGPAVVEYRRHRTGHRTLAKGLLLAAPVPIGISLGVGLYEKHQYDEARERIDNGGPGTIAENTADANHAVRVNRYVATPFFVAGVLCAGAGLYFYITSSTVILTPVASASGGGVSLSGSF